MLQIPTYLDKSPINGIGLYAKNDIPKGTVIWKLTRDVDKAYPTRNLIGMSDLERAFLEKYCFKYHGKLYLCNDDARFMNHSEYPNCVDMGEDKIKGSDIGYTMAARNIKAGEELTCDYRGFGVTPEDLEFNTHGVL
jgi:SET domain-containing protein